MANKYQMTRAAALRVAAAIFATGYPTSYEDVLAALRAEGFGSADRQIDGLVRELSREANEEDTNQPVLARNCIQLIAYACASEAARAREILAGMRRGLSMLGCVFPDDVKPEALKE